MANRKEKPQPIEPKIFASTDEIDRAVAKLERRVKELEALDVAAAINGDTGADDVAISNVRETIREVFGTNSPEYREHGHILLWAGPSFMGMEQHEIIASTDRGRIQTMGIIRGLIDRLKEKREDLGGVAQQISSVDFWRDIHPKITAVARPRYESEHFADAVEAALKEINSIVKDIVKRKTGNELDGASLMRTALTPNSPIICLDDLSTETGKNVQQGYMEIFAGAMTGIRNPKAHDNIKIKENRARHFIYLASLLMHKIDERI